MSFFSSDNKNTMAPVPAPSPGEIVLTRYGVATVLQQPKSAKAPSANDVFRCALWRIPGQSVASEATATLRVSSIVKRNLPVAPGMIVGVDGVDGVEVDWMVMSYSAESDTYELRAKDATRISRHASDLPKSKAAKVVPLLHQLMQRADEASHRAQIFMDSTPVKELTSNIEQKAADLATKAADVAASASASATAVADGQDMEGLETRGSQVASDLRAEVEARMPDGQEIRAIYDMLKDEELTVLLEKAQAKLRQLVDDELPKATALALKTAGIEVDLASPTSPTGAGAGGKEKTFFTTTMMEQSREKALQAVNSVLAKQGAAGDVATIKQEMAQQFGTMFDSLAEAAGSDHTLSSIFEQLNEKTSEWQAISGRLLQTRSVNVFLEGTLRLRKRAQDMFFSEGGSSGLELTKAFTEGDVAVARLKTLELGDAVRSRLVGAIEVRSESEGGLDGMIANAMKSMTVDAESLPFVPSAAAANAKQLQSDLRSRISGLQDTADRQARQSKESLISMLAQKSLYRDMALMKVEQTLVDLESHLDLSAEEMAKIASGEGGTAALLQPLARRAGAEIEKQLDSIQASVVEDGADDTASAILSHVRRIVSGDMSISGLVDEVTDLLNDETLAGAGEDLLTKGESILDAFEGRSGNKTIDDVVAAAEKAGITKSVVMQRMQSIDVDSVLDTASSAATDEDARRELLSTATDQALDFLLNILPSMPVPPFDGVRDGLLYHLSNLSLEGFKVKKEDIGVSIAGIRAGKGSDLVPDIDTSKSKAAIARELLTIDVENISATLDSAVWSFEQTYLPYLKGGGLADSKLWEGCIKLQFELKKQHKKNDSSSKWEPRLCLSERFVSIGEVELKLQGDGKLTWILNKLAEMFKTSLRDYCVSVIASAILKRSGWLLEKLNTHLSPYWPVILRTAHLDMEDLAEVTETDVTDATPDPSDLVYDLVFRDQVPLGINLLLNDESGFVRCVDFPRGSQSRKVATEKGLDPDIFKSATIVSVNGTMAQKHHQSDVMAALKDPGRPKTIQLKIADDLAEAERVRTFAMSSIGGEEKVVDNNSGLVPVTPSTTVIKIDITDEGVLGVKFTRAIDDLGLALGDSGNVTALDGALRDALNSGKLVQGDILSHINGINVLGRNGAGRERALEQLQKFGSKRPLSLQFVKPSSHLLSFQELCVEGLVVGGAEELVLEEKKIEGGGKRVIIKSFQDVAGIAEQSGIFIGDHLISVNGFPVGAGCLKHGDPMPEFKHVEAIIRNESPLALTFARPKREERWTNVMGSNGADIIDGAETFTVAALDADQLGCNFSAGQIAGTIVVGSFKAVKGCVLQTMEKELGKAIIGLSIESVAGQVVPSYASPAMVKAAVARNWPTDIIFRNTAQEEWIEKL